MNGLTWFHRGVFLGGLMVVGSALAQEQRRQDRELMNIIAPTQVPARGRINAVDATWEAWQKRTGELPPDFSKLRSTPFAPDPLEGIRLSARGSTGWAPTPPAPHFDF